MAIIIPAHFKICSDCKRHGHIVFSDGSESDEVATESAALLQLEKARNAGKLREVEIALVKEQIRDSGLPRSAYDEEVTIIGFITEDMSEKEIDEWALARKAHMN